MAKMKLMRPATYRTDMIGWVGVAILIASMLIADVSDLGQRHYVFYILNLIGAVCVVIYAIGRKSRQTLVLDAFASLAAIASLVKMLAMMR